MPSLRTVLGFVIGGAAFYILMEWQTSRRPRPIFAMRAPGKLMSPERLLRYYVMMGGICGGFFLNAIRGSQADLISALCSSAGLVFFVWSIGAYFHDRHDINEHGLTVRRLFRRNLTFAWEDIKSVRYSRFEHSFRITLKSTEKVTLHSALAGMPDFANAVRYKIPAAVADTNTWRELTVISEPLRVMSPQEFLASKQS